MASAFTISDSLVGVTWEPHFDAPQLHDGLAVLADAAISVLANRHQAGGRRTDHPERDADSS